MWKITNNSKPGQNIKIAVAKNNTTTIGVILEPDHFCISDSRMTSSIDAQSKRNFITIEENYTNDLGLELCKSYSESNIDEARKQAEEYKG
jgi:hypothetical protein